MPHKPIRRSFYVEAYARTKSFPTAMRAMRFVVEYGRACDETGEVLTTPEYGTHVGCSQAQAYRRRQAFIQCFPNQTVESVWAIVKPALDASPFRNEHSRAQAVFAGSIVATWNVP